MYAMVLNRLLCLAMCEEPAETKPTSFPGTGYNWASTAIELRHCCAPVGTVNLPFFFIKLCKFWMSFFRGNRPGITHAMTSNPEKHIRKCHKQIFAVIGVWAAWRSIGKCHLRPSRRWQRNNFAIDSNSLNMNGWKNDAGIPGLSR